MIRPATTSDIPALVRLMQLVQDLHAAEHPEVFKSTLAEGPTAAFFSEVLANDKNLVLVAERRGEVVGYIWCQERPPSDSFYAHARHTGYVHHVSVDAQHRRNGIGSALAEATIQELRRRGATSVGVDFWSFNERARAFFTKTEFVPQRTIASREL